MTPDEDIASPASARYRRNPHVIETDLGSELILLDPDTQQMFSLNPTGCLVWQALDGTAPLRAVVQRVVAAFEVAPEAAARDVDTLISQLAAAGLVRSVGSG